MKVSIGKDEYYGWMLSKYKGYGRAYDVPEELVARHDKAWAEVEEVAEELEKIVKTKEA